MKHYVIYNQEGIIVRHGQTSTKALKDIPLEMNESIIEGVGRQIANKVVNGKIVDKTPEEIEADKPPVPVPVPEPIPFEDQQARVTNKQWQNVTDRLNVLEQGDL